MCNRWMENSPVKRLIRWDYSGGPLVSLAIAVTLIFTPTSSYGDIVLKKDGQSLMGEIRAMDGGKLVVTTPQGDRSVSLEDIEKFQVESKREEGGIDEQTFNQFLATQQQIAQKLDALTIAVDNLQRQIVNVQTAQGISAQRLTQRTQEVNPLGRMVVLNYQSSRQGGRTVVTGQVMNQSETPMNNVQVEVAIFGNAGRLGQEGGVKTETVFAQPQNLVPGQVGTFTVSFRDYYVFQNINFNVRGLPPVGFSAQPPTIRSTGDF